MSLQQEMNTLQLQKLRKKKDDTKKIYTAYEELLKKADAIGEMASKLDGEGLTKQNVHHVTYRISGVRDTLFARWVELCDEETRLLSSEHPDQAR